MNLRTLKKHCQRAVVILIAEHGYKPSDFARSDGEEAISAPTRMERRFVRNGFLEPGPLKGTWLLWQKTSYEYDEWDADLPSVMLDEIIFWSKWQPTAEDLAA